MLTIPALLPMLCTTELEHKLNFELQKIEVWTTTNKLTINSLKSYALVISPHTKKNILAIDISYKQRKIEVVDTVKYLVIYLDKLQFKQHIGMLETKLFCLLGILYKTKSFIS